MQFKIDNCKKIKIAFIILLLAPTWLFLFNNSKDDTAQVQDQLLLIAGTSADNPPYESLIKNKIVGLDIDIIKLISKEIDRKLIIKNFDFPILLSALVTKKVDLAIAGMSISSAREKYLDFSEVYLTSRIAALFNSKNSFTDSASLSGKKIGAQLGTTWNEAAKSINKDYPKLNLRLLSSNLLLLEELKAGAIDVIILEEAQAMQFVQKNTELKAIILNEYVSEFAIAFPKNSLIKDQVNNAIKKLKKNGTINQVKEKWFDENI